MNERFLKLAEQAAKFSAITALPTGKSGDELFVEKFAELLVKECRDMFVVSSVSWNLLNEKLEHFGAE